MLSTSVLDVVPSPIEPSDALAQRTRSPSIPYKVNAWEQALQAANLLTCFIDIPSGLHNGFLIDLPSLLSIQSFPNKDSALTYVNEFHKMIEHELTKGRHIGPFSEPLLLLLIGPFQSSPISIIPKPGRPAKFRIIQNFSFPQSPSTHFPNPSINSYINVANFPTSWGTFSIVYLLISRLPPGFKAATHNVAEANHTIPLHQSQWPAAVVHASHNEFYIDTETTKLTQELAVKLEQGRDLCQWHSMAD